MTTSETGLETQTTAEEPTKTFGELRKRVLAKARVRDHFAFRAISRAHVEYWDRLNTVEYERGYTPDYTKPGTPALRDMKLLTATEFEEWLRDCPSR